MFEGTDIVFIHGMGFLVAGLLFGQLLEETLLLVERIVELGEGVSQLTADNEKLEAVDDLGIRIVLPRQRGDFGRILGNERGMPQFGLGYRIEKLSQQFAVPDVLVELQPKPGGDPQKLLAIFENRRIDVAVLDNRLATVSRSQGGVRLTSLPP
jgi:hypothetical protein